MLIINGYVIDPITGLTGLYDIEIKDGKILHIFEAGSLSATKGQNIVDATGCYVSPGFIDIHSHFRDPGNGSEDIISGAKSAAKGGYTTVILMANTTPPIDNVKLLDYVYDKAKGADAQILQLATITKGMAGSELTDFSSLLKSGAIGFSDDGKNIENESVARKAMQRAVEVDAVLAFHEEAAKYIQGSGINDGVIAIELDLPGANRLAEEFMIERDIKLSLETGAHIHIQHVSSKGSVELIKTGKEKGAHVTAEATPHHFSLTEDAILKYGTNAKMNPPLRELEDKLAIIEGLKSGVIDIIATDHAPHKQIDKDKPFQNAPSGIIGLETAFSLCIENLYKESGMALYDIVAALTKKPAELYGLKKGIKEGLLADIVIYDIDKTTTYDSFVSKSENTPFKGKTLGGKILYTIHNGHIVYSNINNN